MQTIGRVLVGAFIATLLSASIGYARELTFAERVNAQRLIREYYLSRLSPEEQAEFGPLDGDDEAVVREHVRKSVALEKVWGVHLKAEVIHRELDRIAMAAPAPQELSRLFSALNEDALVLQESLARPLLTDRLVRDLFSRDQVIHADARDQAATLRNRLLAEGPGFATTRPDRLVTFERVSFGDARKKALDEVFPIPESEYSGVRAQFPPSAVDVGAVLEEPTKFSIHRVVSDGADFFRVARFEIPKRSWEDWWKEARSSFAEESLTCLASPVARVANPGTRTASPASPRGVTRPVSPASTDRPTWLGSAFTRASSAPAQRRPQLAPHVAERRTHMGTDFYLVFTDNSLASVDGTLVITARQDASGIVSIPGAAISIPFSVAANQAATITIPVAAMVTGSDRVVVDGAIHVASDHEVSVYFFNPAEPVFSNDALVALPTDVLGDQYVVVAWPETISARGYVVGGSSFVAIAATVDGTSLDITPSASTGTRVAGTTYVVTLGAGDVYVLRAGLEDGGSGFEDLTGTRIQSSSPIAVFAGNVCADIPAGSCCCDHLVDEVLPDDAWGQEFLLAPYADAGTSGDHLRVLGTQDGTSVALGGGGVVTLDAGELYSIGNLLGSVQISATAPVLVAQFHNGAEWSGTPDTDPSMTLVTPVSAYATEYLFWVPPDHFSNYAQLIAPASTQSTCQVDLSSPAFWSPIGDGEYGYVNFPLDFGVHSASCAEPFALQVYGHSSYGSYSFPGGARFGCGGPDDDGDGFGSVCDCLDSDSTVFPGATEICNDRDDNCVAGDDEGCNDDHDAYCDISMGTPGTPATCPGGGGDCDDLDASRNPGVIEICGNHKDDDCDHVIDLDCANSYVTSTALHVGRPVDGLELPSPPVVYGNELRIVVDLRNSGPQSTSGSFFVSAGVCVDGANCSTFAIEVPQLQPGEFRRVEFPLWSREMVYGIRNGPLHAIVTVDPEHRVQPLSDILTLPFQVELRPIIIIPGIMGSELHVDQRINGGDVVACEPRSSAVGDALWLDADDDCFQQLQYTPDGASNRWRHSTLTGDGIIANRIFEEEESTPIPLIGRPGPFTKNVYGNLETALCEHNLKNLDCGLTAQSEHSSGCFDEDKYMDGLPPDEFPSADLSGEDRCKASSKLIEFPWNWSDSIMKSEAMLRAAIVRAAQNSPDGTVDLIAHSMGGLLTRSTLVNQPGIAGRVSHVVYLGTPFRGSLDTIYMIHEGEIDRGMWKKSPDWLFDNPTIKEVGRTLPSAYELIRRTSTNERYRYAIDSGTNSLLWETDSYPAKVRWWSREDRDGDGQFDGWFPTGDEECAFDPRGNQWGANFFRRIRGSSGSFRAVVEGDEFGIVTMDQSTTNALNVQFIPQSSGHPKIDTDAGECVSAGNSAEAVVWNISGMNSASTKKNGDGRVSCLSATALEGVQYYQAVEVKHGDLPNHKTVIDQIARILGGVDELGPLVALDLDTPCSGSPSRLDPSQDVRVDITGSNGVRLVVHSPDSRRTGYIEGGVKLAEDAEVDVSDWGANQTALVPAEAEYKIEFADDTLRNEAIEVVLRNAEFAAMAGRIFGGFHLGPNARAWLRLTGTSLEGLELAIDSDGDGSADATVIGVADQDGDGVPDGVDRCVGGADPEQGDQDGDGLSDGCDDDDDGDGILDAQDNCPLDPNPTQADGDGDGMGDACDRCPTDAKNDLDGDWLCGSADSCEHDPFNDVDGDGLCGDVDPCPQDPSNLDSDSDGRCNVEDNCPTRFNPNQFDTNGNGVGNDCEFDDDGDGIADSSDNCRFRFNSDQLDTDLDREGDACDVDDDNDRIDDPLDNCPLHANSEQQDTDLDGLGNQCDDCPADASNDVDGDGLCSGQDNCKSVWNPDQIDGDLDQFGFVCDCDDSNAAVNPGRGESCDGTDNNCDGRVDEGPVVDKKGLDRRGEANGRLGVSIASLPDVNNDGVPDYAAGAPEARTIVAPGAGIVVIFSGANSEIVRRIFDADGHSEAKFGASVARISDLDSDGIDDLLVGAPNDAVGGAAAGAIFAFSARTGRRIFRVANPEPEAGDRFGAAIAAIGDLNSDGIPDFAVGTPGDDNASGADAGSVDVFLGGSIPAYPVRWGRVSDPAGQAGAMFGGALAGVDDVNHDAVPDIAVSSYLADVGSAVDAGRISVFSGLAVRNQAAELLLYNVVDPGGMASAHFGRSVSSIPDVDGDLTPEIVVGAPGDRGGSGSVLTFSGASHELLYKRSAPDPSPSAGLGFSVGGSGDIDGDSIADVLAGAPGDNGETGCVLVLSGANGSIVSRLLDPTGAVGDRFGASVVGLADLDGDGRREVLAAAIGDDTAVGQDSGSVVVVNGARVSDPDGDGLGSACDTDDDGDDVVDEADNCPDIQNIAQEDADGDGTGDPCDSCPTLFSEDQGDADGDSVGDACDCAPLDPNNGPPSEVVGRITMEKSGASTTIRWLGDHLSSEGFQVYRGWRKPGVVWRYDQYCLVEAAGANAAQDQLSPLQGEVFYYLVSRVGCGESSLGRDSEGWEIPNIDPCPSVLSDADGDGTEEAIDTCAGAYDPEQLDGDGDGHGDLCDNCAGVVNPTQDDQDGDAIGDYCDSDVDGDDVANETDNCPIVTNPAQEDEDEDGRGNLCDNCPAVANASQEDVDNDAVGDQCDNCPTTPNRPQVDLNGNGVGDACEQPWIFGFDPSVAGVGEIVTILGTQLAPSTGSPEVMMRAKGGGTVSAPVMSFDATQIVCVVPAGAVSGVVTVIAGPASVTSNESLIIIPARSAKPRSSSRRRD